MIEIIPAVNRRSVQDFFSCTDDIYKDYPNHRRTEDDVARLLLNKRSASHVFCRIKPYTAYDGKRCIGRFLLSYDSRSPQIVMIGFFEGNKDYPELAEAAFREARLFAPDAQKVLMGIAVHINYQAGFSLDAFDNVPAFGMPHTAPWYLSWFSDWQMHTMRSWEFPAVPFFTSLKKCMPDRTSGITVRPLSFKNVKADIALYTDLNNRCFQEHSFWINRHPSEDNELFLPFKPFLNPENLLFAEKDGKAIGFVLWYPDFNQLNPAEGLGIRELLKYRIFNPLRSKQSLINRFRLTQIAVLPEYRTSDASYKMIYEMAHYVQKDGYTAGEGGFIFDNNSGSLALTSRFFSRILGISANEMQSKHFAVFSRTIQ